ncbi:conjugative transposon protein TraM [Mucilaginibacter limnophilus]|uniref:Conjugative transposon protein TraM n=1 Tax=Mucilaginibacter limnophilus TaxID=1932778 RepID=A0A3S2WWN1_9SPHI|nr:conjugative transposon protein TraM [Mucilaginibacter limnophilus]RVT98459.1 conjugative transposon protein TraM [Mucilaginibacter limnophilus]
MEKQRKFYLVLPLLVLPFLTMAFWALGGGKGGRDTAVYGKGLDTDLPEAQFGDKEKNDKLAVYQAAQRDSARDGISPAFLHAIGLAGDSANHTAQVTTTDEQAQQLQNKLAALNRQIGQPQSEPAPAYDEPEPAQVRRLNRLMEQAGHNGGADDPELRQLDKMLDKLQAIQNPATVAPVKAAPEASTPFRTIPALIDGKQKIANGAAVKMKLNDSVRIKGQLLPRGQVLFGTAQIANQRLLVQIKNIRSGIQIIPVDLTVFSEDGMPGIPAPEAELSGITASNADQTLQSMQIMSMDQSLGAQAAAGGINAAKDLFSKKVKKIKVKLMDAYPVLLKINK